MFHFALLRQRHLLPLVALALVGLAFAPAAIAKPKPASYIQAGEAALRAGDPAAAALTLEEGRQKAKPSASLLVLLGAAYLAQDRFADAEAVTQEALKLDAKAPGAQFQLGAIYQRLGWPESALEAFQQALAQTPGDPAVQIAVVKGLLGAGRAAEAEKACRDFLGETMKDAGLIVALGESLEAQEAYMDAFNMYGLASVTDPRNADARARRGRLYCRFAQFDAAATECRAALAIDPHHALAHACLALAYAQEGQTEASREHAAQAEAAGMNMESIWGKLAQ